MLLQYGCVNLNLLHVRSYERVALYEQANYIGTKYRLVVRAVYNPGTQSDSWAFTPRYEGGSKLPIPYVPAGADPRAAGANNPGIGIAPVGPPQFSPPLNLPPVRQGVPAVVSDVALRHALMQPRQQLIFSIGGIVNIFSPLAGFQTDVIGGPTPIYCNVQEVQGTRTWVVDYCIETVINECPVYAGAVPVLLSNTWTMAHTLDESYWVTQTIEGRAVFRMDGLIRLGNQPDNYRGLFMLPPMPGFKRERIEVRVGNPPNVVEYRLTDRQLPLGWSAAGVTKVKATHTVRTNKPAGDMGAVKQFTHGLRQMGGLAGRQVGTTAKRAAEAGKPWAQMLNPANAVNPRHWKRAIDDSIAAGVDLLADQAAMLGDAIGVGADALAGGIENVVSHLPINYHTVAVDVLGDATSTRDSLEQYARNLIDWRLAFVNNTITQPGTKLADIMQANGLGDVWNSINQASGIILAAMSNVPGLNQVLQPQNVLNLLGTGALTLFRGYDHTVTHDLTGKGVHVEMTLITGPLLSLLGRVGVSTSTLASQGIFPVSDDSGPFLSVTSTPAGPPGDGVSRGSYIGQCVAAAFQSSCELPHYPDILPGPDMRASMSPPFLLPPSSPYLTR